MNRLTFLPPDQDTHSGFYSDLQTKVSRSLSDQGLRTHANMEFWCKAAFWTLLCWGNYLWLLLGAFQNGVWLLLLALVSGLAGLMLGFNTGHDAAHRAVTGQAWLDDLIHHLSFLTVGIDPLLWRLRHVRSHHLYANVLGSDQDIDKNPFLRLSPKHEWRPRHRHQAYFAPFVYSMALLHSVLWGDWVYLLSDDYEWMRRGRSKAILMERFILFKALHWSVTLLVPYLSLNLPITSILGAYFLVSMAQSLVFVILLVGTHFFDEADFPAPSADSRLPHNWAVHQLVTSCDWMPQSHLAAFICGGANAHAMHHLFPCMCHTHYRSLNPLLEESASAHGVAYHKKSLNGILSSHFRFLHRMGRGS